MGRGHKLMTVGAFMCAVLGHGCSWWCHSCIELEIDLAPPSSDIDQRVTVVLREVDGDDGTISCAWGADASSPERHWTCAKNNQTPTSSSNGYFVYPLSDSEKSWTIELKGPSGTVTLTRVPRSTDPGEGTVKDLVSCSPCSSGALYVTEDDLVGAGVSVPGRSDGRARGGARVF